MSQDIFRGVPLLGILRGIEYRHLDPVLDVAVKSGLKAIEITMNTDNAPKLIQKAVKISRGKVTVGAGTVLSTKDLKVALNSGAGFIVMPVLVEEVVAFCVKNHIPVFPGAFTPQEIYRAWVSGATMVKLFPVKFLGPGYIKEIKAPLEDVKILACGGVSVDNLREYFLKGANAVSFGASVFRKDLLEEKNYRAIEEGIKKLIINLPRGENNG